MDKALWTILGVLLAALCAVIVGVAVVVGPQAAFAASALVGIVALYVWLCFLVGQSAGRKGRNETTWFVLALLLGLVVPAVIVAIMSVPQAPVVITQVLAPPQARATTVPSPATTTCYYCGETILRTAKKCKHCGEFLGLPPE